MRLLQLNEKNIFDLIARDNHPTNFGCINVWSIDLWVSLILKLHPLAKTDTYAPGQGVGVISTGEHIVDDFSQLFQASIRQDDFYWRLQHIYSLK